MSACFGFSRGDVESEYPHCTAITSCWCSSSEKTVLVLVSQTRTAAHLGENRRPKDTHVRTGTTGRTAALHSGSSCSSVVRHSRRNTHTSRSVGCEGELLRCKIGNDANNYETVSTCFICSSSPYYVKIQKNNREYRPKTAKLLATCRLLFPAAPIGVGVEVWNG